jgi:hypothetical protein
MILLIWGMAWHLNQMLQIFDHQVDDLYNAAPLTNVFIILIPKSKSYEVYELSQW